MITPPNVGSGAGSCLPLIVVVALGEPRTPVTWGAPAGPPSAATATWRAAAATMPMSRVQPFRPLTGGRCRTEGYIPILLLRLVEVQAFQWPPLQPRERWRCQSYRPRCPGRLTSCDKSLGQPLCRRHAGCSPVWLPEPRGPSAPSCRNRTSRCGKGKLKPGRVHRIVDGRGEIALHLGCAGVVRPGPQLEVDGTVAIALEQALGRRVLQDLRMGARHAFEQRDHPGRRRAVVQAHREVQAALLIAEGPVGHLPGDQLGVGDDDLGPLRGAHDAGADADAPHPALQVPHLDGVADVDRALEQQDQAGDEVVDHALQAEADAHAQGPRQDRHLGQSVAWPSKHRQSCCCRPPAHHQCPDPLLRL